MKVSDSRDSRWTWKLRREKKNFSPVLKSRENWFSRRQRDIRCFLTNFLISRRLIIEESGEEANENKHGERRVGEKEKKESSPPPCSENPSAMGGNKSKFRIINNARGRIVRVPRFPGVNQLLLFSPARSFPTGDDEQIRGVTRGC